ncbi:hypothetical protein LB452_11400 [Psychroflexus sp. CAK8W]|uniref:Uncharacterized protein n=1 Tax=Psychroflexus longus TaxID=2873596 RepID=A0ABS7XKL0_9FLAO|nr:hypothetical protein [Psychroflexus longus]MBZ9779527.1 hypothetical protein [Psychroflexus longus]
MQSKILEGIINEYIKEGIKRLGKKSVFRMVGKVLGRALNRVGVTWAVADFSYCMYKANVNEEVAS